MDKKPSCAWDRLLKRTSGARQDAHPSGPCLDAEMLAAWTDGGLTPHERAAAESHLAECDRCLSVLAAVAKASPPPQATSGVRWLSARWLVPLTTVAVTITVWFLVQSPLESPLAPPAPPSPVETVKPTEPVTRAETDLRAEAQTEASRKRVAPVPNRSGARDEDASRRAAGSTLADSVAPAAKPDATLEKREVVAEPAAPPPPATAATAPPLPRRDSLPQTESTRSETRADNFRSVARQAFQGALVIVSPEPAVRWRVSGTSVERSTDGGLTWRAQFTAAGASLLAGSSPNRDVCWLVGRNGVVLVSSDGEVWRRLDSPDSTVDLTHVTARDAMTATVTASNGRSFQTTDGGRTWTPQEFLATPF